jgi:hypothetical protein
LNSAETQTRSTFIKPETLLYACPQILVDSRRGRVLRKLATLLLGERLDGTLNRLRLRTWILLALMLIVHVICFVIVIQLFEMQTHRVSEVFGMTLAIDRSQVRTTDVQVHMYRCTDVQVHRHRQVTGTDDRVDVGKAVG